MSNSGDIKLVNLKRDVGATYDLYIGRANQHKGLPHSKWANPFRLDRESDRSKVLDLYRKHVLSRPELVLSLKELKGKTLACWCHPKACHGDVLIELYDRFVADE